MSSAATLLDQGLSACTPGSRSTGEIRPWKPARPGRLPVQPPQGLKLRDADIFIIDERCKGCNFCIEFCPKDVLEASKKLNQIGVHPPQVIDSQLCVGCGVCEDICPDFAIFLIDKGRPSMGDE